MGHPALDPSRSGPGGPAPPAPQATVPGPGRNHKHGSPSAIQSQTRAGARPGGHPAVGLRAPAIAAGKGLLRVPDSRSPEAPAVPPAAARGQPQRGAQRCGNQADCAPAALQSLETGGRPASSSSSSSNGPALAPTSSDADTRWWGLPRATWHTSHPHPPPDGLKARCGCPDGSTWMAGGPRVRPEGSEVLKASV